MMPTKLYVGNLSFDATEVDLRDLFEQAGTIVDAIIINDRMTGESRGFGFVTLSTEQEARDAIQKFDGADFKGRNLRINEARDR